MKLEKGDLIFIYRGQEPLDDAIAHIFKGFNDYYFNHVGIYIGNDEVIEAISPEVIKKSLDEFLENTQGEIVVGQTNYHIKKHAADLAKKLIGAPYNETFIPSNEQFYCSSLIHHVFEKANHFQPYFKKHRMSFKEINSDQIMPFWIKYYQQKGMDVPEGVEGSHPANLSLDEKIKTYFIL